MNKTENSKDEKIEEMRDALNDFQDLGIFAPRKLLLKANDKLRKARHDLLIEVEKIIDDIDLYEFFDSEIIRQEARSFIRELKTKLEKLKQ